MTAHRKDVCRADSECCDALWALGSREHTCIWDNYSVGLKHVWSVNKHKIMVYNDL